MHTIGTPAASARSAVPWPQCVIASDACWRIAVCGAFATTTTFGAGDTTASAASAGPSVTSARTGSCASAATICPSADTWFWNVDDNPTSTIGSWLAAGQGGVQPVPAHDGSSRIAPAYRTFEGKAG